ncbi:hypothetical protein [Egbenema bharatensis]|uniref:hypothetical protein n=1 Tax=Egbenema bharatensis TaxID=3463334 RepID=UPI000D049E50|nr:hypothetical protein C7B76_25295 [filamentous cyanobacterium CCP2]
MAVNTLNVSFEELKTIILQLPVENLMELSREIEERLETVGIMQLAESGFQEWNDEEEDIYDVES